MGFFEIMKRPPIPFGKDYPLFKRLSIETSSRCNRTCPFCPVAFGHRDFKQELMDEALFVRIVKQLGYLRWNGFAQLFLLNEPLLNQRLPNEIATIREYCPESTIYVSSNGDPLVPKDPRKWGWALDRLNTLYLAGLNTLNLNVYDLGAEGDAQAERYMEFAIKACEQLSLRMNNKKYRPTRPRVRSIAVTDMRTDRNNLASSTDKLYNRANEQRAPKLARQLYCSRPQNHLVIDWKGRVPICCGTDPSKPESGFVGDLRKQTIKEVWQSEAFFKYRWFTQRAERVLPDCSTCEHRPAYAHVVRKVSASRNVARRWRTEAKKHLKKKGFTPGDPRDG